MVLELLFNFHAFFYFDDTRGGHLLQEYDNISTCKIYRCAQNTF